ncbi:MAG TPA: hypothetical protein VGJ07_17490 [Rugosimonospora sp.]|jgi:hypothetical protein
MPEVEHHARERGGDDGTPALPSARPNPHHRRHTVDALLRLVPGAVELAGSPEPPAPGFAAHLPDFVATIERFARAGGG